MSEGSSILGDYYGLDWAVLVVGLTANYLISNTGRLYLGLAIGVVAGLCSLSVACMSHQYGFIVYQMLSVGLNLRGLYTGWKKIQAVTQRTLDVATLVPVRSAAANDQAPARDPFPSAPAVAA